MKEKKYKFEQTIVQIVETKYIYKVESKSYIQAEKKFKEAFDKKVENGTEFKPIKKFLSNVELTGPMNANPEILGKSTLTIEYIPNKKTGLSSKQLFNNVDNIWCSFDEIINENISDESDESKEIQP